MKNMMQLKALVKNYARKYGLNEPVTMQVYIRNDYSRETAIVEPKASNLSVTV